MAAGSLFASHALPGPDLEVLGRHWGRIVVLGILMVVLGAIAMGSSVLMTLATMVFAGWLLIVGGAVEVAHAFACKAWKGFFVDLLTGVLYAVTGFMVVANPGASAAALTLVIAMFLIFGGVFRILMALFQRQHHWPWLLLHGVVTLLLGIAVWRQWPLSGLWVIGLFVGVDMLLNGWTLVMLGLAARARPAEGVGPAAVAHA